MKILLIEDNPDDILIIKRLLRGLNIEEAQTGALGLERLKENQFDCILLDYRLPDTNALELLSKIKQVSKTPVIILTGIRDERLIIGASKKGAIDFLIKDEINEAILKEAIKDSQTKKHKREFLEKGELVFEKLVEGMNEGLLALDIRETIVFVNRRLEEILGYEDLLGKGIFEIMERDEYSIFKEMYLSKKHQSFETSFISLGKNKIPVLISISPLFDKNGVFNGSLCVVTDLSKIKEMEARIIEAQKLSAAGQIAAMAAHDIKNPLSTIVSGMYLLKKFLSSDERTNKIVSQIDNACHKISLYVDDLLNFSRPLCINKRKIEINPIIEEFLEEDLFFKQLKGIEIKKELEENLPPVYGDPERLKEALFNLVRNSCDSMPDGGVVRIKTYQMANSVGIDIADTGIGIAEEDIDKIFSPFFTTKGKGIGLGLAIVQRIVSSHQGEIKVKSKPDKGATFTILFKKAID